MTVFFHYRKRCKIAYKYFIHFLAAGEYELEYIEDGINAETRAIDYLKKSETVTNSDTFEINLASGGGWIGKLVKKPTKL